MPSDGQAASLLAAVAVAASVVVGVAFALFKSSPGDKGANETAQVRQPVKSYARLRRFATAWARAAFDL